MILYLWLLKFSGPYGRHSTRNKMATRRRCIVKKLIPYADRRESLGQPPSECVLFPGKDNIYQHHISSM
ncbi:hypothetical protein Plhal703r1_c01g0006741 [Plasmopara halstedii]